MMFGFFKFRGSVNHAYIYVFNLFAPARITGEIPSHIFLDPYILGYLQSVVMHAACEKQEKILPPEQLYAIFLTVMEKFYKENTNKLKSIMVEYNDENHQKHAIYIEGKNDGVQHVRSLFENNESVMHSYIAKFTQAVKNARG